MSPASQSDRSALLDRVVGTSLFAVALAGTDLLAVPGRVGTTAWAAGLALALLGPSPAGDWLDRRALRTGVRAAVAILIGGLFVWLFDLPGQVLWFVPAWLALSGVAWWIARREQLFDHLATKSWVWLRGRRWEGPWPETIRIAGILGIAVGLMSGYVQRTLVGGGDALWYSMILGDAVEQTRHGVFPVWVGQSLYQFNGAFYPVRIAPAFHLVGSVLDLLTARSLGLFALLNLEITLIGVAGALSAYFALGSLLPGRRWIAFALAILFVGCPGVLGLAYNTDLFMSWTTLPVVPWVLWGIVRSFESIGRARALLVLGAALGAAWWGHSPIALWLTIATAVTQAVRLVLDRPVAAGIRDSVAGAVAFLAVAAYPIGSVLCFPPEPGVDAAGFQAAEPREILRLLREVQPAVYLRVNDAANQLGDFQLGYTLWVVLLLAPLAFKRRARAAWTVWAFAFAVAVLLNPGPSGNFFWEHVPALVRNTTGNWVMNRLYLILAVTTVFALAAGLARKADGGRRRWLLAAGLVVGVAWTVAEAAKFPARTRNHRRPEATADSMVLPENRMITRFAYLVFPRWPDVFSHGVATPELQNRLRGEAGELLVDDFTFARQNGSVVASGELDLVAGVAGPSQAAEPLPLLPGESYVLEIEFLRPPEDSAGTLQFAGATFFREYGLPDTGGGAAFGVGGNHSSLIGVSTSSPAPEHVVVRFFPAVPARTAGPFARFRLFRYDPRALPVQVQGWIPYSAKVRSDGDAWLETPRMYQQHYVAEIGDRPAPIRKSPDGLLQVQVPAGESTVTVRYAAPLVLQALFWISFLSLVGLAAVGLKSARIRDIRGQKTSS